MFDGTPMVGFYDYRLVLLSVVISCAASFAALDLGGRVTSATGAARRLWLAGGATAMGIGIWSMHYIGMLAFHLPVPVLYDWPTVLLSLLAAIGASGIALFVVSRPLLGAARAGIGSIFMGAGISAMHYIGMAAMRLPAMCRWSLPLVGLSIVLAMAISFAALWLTFHMRGDIPAWGWKKLASALVMGAAIPVMHYTGMAAASFHPAPLAPHDLFYAVSVSSLGILGIAGATLTLLALVVFSAMADREFSHQILGRREAETALVDRERVYQTTFDAAPVGIAHATLAGQWLRVNPQLCALLDTDAERLKETTIFGLMHPDDTLQGETVHRMLMEGTTDRAVFQTRYRRADGQYIWVSVTMSANRNAAGQPSGLVLIVEDITERRTLEQQFRQSQKMEAIGRLAAGVAHDFNNLLTVIIGFIELTCDRLDPDHPSREELQQALIASRSAASLTGQLLAFSRKQILRPEILNLNAVIQRMDMLLRRAVGEQVRIHVELAPSVHHVSADPGQIEQVVMNLAVNARDAMPAGGVITIESSNVDVDSADAKTIGIAAGPHVRIAISDTGVGMPESVRARLFEPFFTTKARGKGTGLGLATVYGIVKQSGGSIAVDSELGKGTTFNVYLPRATEAATEPTAALPVAESLGGSETILLAEDQPDVRSLMRATLTGHGYTVIAMPDAEGALRAASAWRGPIHLLLTDVVMPGMSGGDLARLMVEQRPPIRVLFTSGYADHSIVQQGVIERGLAFIQKPFSPDDLLRKVRSVLDAPAVPNGSEMVWHTRE
jgi:PAS domain S-box-containing protein